MLAYEAAMLTELGRAPEAVRQLEQSRPAWEKLPDRYCRWGIFANALARAYVATGRYKEAEGLISQVMAACGKLAPPPMTGFAEYIWAESLAGQHRYEEALQHAEYTKKVWSSFPASVTLKPEAYKRISDLNHLLAEIHAHLDSPPHPSPQPNPHAS
jgi:tetratricopeptide (TPR) repeat protein